MKHTKKMLAVSAVAVSLFSLSACSSTLENAQLGTPVKIGSSDGHRPVWAENLKEYQKEHSDRVYFVGLSGNVADYSLAREEAYADALQNLANGIKDTVHNLYTAAKTQDGDQTDYNYDVEKAVEDGTLQTAKGIITGASVDKYFWNKYVKKNGDGRIDEYLSVYALVSLSKEDYRKTVELTLTDEQKVTKDVRARGVIKEMKKLYLKNGETK